MINFEIINGLSIPLTVNAKSINFPASTSSSKSIKSCIKYGYTKTALISAASASWKYVLAVA
ncbi:MAG: hypothetical protein KA270_13095 [Saprospiraceae bacterium]|nr:hypothetical protein [Saprospiraceae bacterium]MBP6568100.1 hypothetical protein [Saprospiraceae bacterium]